MEKVKIAIIDTGLASEFVYYKDVIGGCKFWIAQQSIYMAREWTDIQGHGTMVAATIKKYCPNSLLYVVKIYDKDARTSSVLLLQALEHLLEIDVKYVNISLAVEGNTYMKEISNAMMRLKQQGKIIFSSVKNGRDSSFPADDLNCYGVKSKEGINCARNQMLDEKTMSIWADGSEEYVEIVKGVEKAFQGNSKATAKMLGMTATWVSKNIPENIYVDKAMLDQILLEDK